ncbi:lipopolysaccharide heptosyltransferase II [Thiomonas sp. FB-6]|uniref:lipopolysaccharide heptosyltransferase II n=1 Tax=Thiomonas sp. FB-6 TaxID=1158291 RepID=UPI00037403AA|nr:lipopolysaccharide heptosyltransferase II [Thiomonas sp. FB-6]
MGGGRPAAAPSLLVAPQWIGDAVMAQPLVALLAARGERVTALGLPGVAPVLRAMPGIERVIETPFAHGRLDLRSRRALARELRREAYARAYVLGNNLKSRLVPWLARIPLRVGWRGEAAGALLTHALQAPAEAARAGMQARQRGDMREHYAALAQELCSPGFGTGVPAAPVREVGQPLLRVDPASASAEARGFGLEPGFIALCPGAEYGPAKQWPAAHYAELAELAHAAGRRVVILGGPREREAAQAIREAAPRADATDLCGRTSMQQAIALLAAAGGVVSNDSGLMHVAAALGRPTVGLYGSTDPRHTPPAAHRSATLWLHLPCSPCFQRNCPLGHLNCLRALDPQWAWSALSELMAAAG